VVHQVSIYAFPLASHTKLAIDTVLIGLAGRHLCNVAQPAAFATHLRRALRHSRPVSYQDFRTELVRLRVRVTYCDSTWADVFLDKGGKYALFHQQVYRLHDNKPLARLLRRALPVNSTQVIDLDLQHSYQKDDFAPMEQ
jgi:hypothetical protein